MIEFALCFLAMVFLVTLYLLYRIYKVEKTMTWVDYQIQNLNCDIDRLFEKGDKK